MVKRVKAHSEASTGQCCRNDPDTVLYSSAVEGNAAGKTAHTLTTRRRSGLRTPESSVAADFISPC